MSSGVVFLRLPEHKTESEFIKLVVHINAFRGVIFKEQKKLFGKFQRCGTIIFLLCKDTAFFYLIQKISMNFWIIIRKVRLIFWIILFFD